MAEWRDISTAPMNGESVIIAAFREGDCIVGEAYFYTDGSDRGWWWANTSPGDYYAETLLASGWNPAHWMPLPPAPEAQENDDE